MTWRKTLVLILAVELLVLAVLAVVFSGMIVALEERELIGIRSLFPSGPVRPLILDEWKGFALPSRFRVLSSPCGEGVDLEALLRKSFDKPRLVEPVSIGERGLYGLKKRGKGYALAVIFKQGDAVFWLDVHSPHSSLDHARRSFHTCLLNLEVQGRAPSSALAGELNRIEGRTSPFVIQSVRQFALFLGGIFLTVMAAVWFFMRLSGAPPASASTAALCTPFQTMVVRGTGRRSSPCCLCLENGQLAVFVFRKEKARIDLKKDRGPLRLVKRRLTIGPYLFLLDDEALERWRVHLGIGPGGEA